jgi:hypothetical protein
VPPSRSTSTAAREASGCEVATIALVAWTVDLPGKWKFLIEFLALSGLCQAFGRSWRAVSEKPGLHDTIGPVGAMLAYQEMAAIRWMYGPFADRSHAGFPGGLCLLNEPP